MRKCKTKSIHHARFGYITLSFLGCILSLIVIFVGPSLSDKLDEYGIVDCNNDDLKCIGTSTTYRIGFSMGLFFCITTLIALIGGEIYVLFEYGCWPVKFGLFVSLLALSFLIPNSAFNWILAFSIIFSIIFLGVQLILFIDFSYTWNQTWIANYDIGNESKFWLFWMFFFTGLSWVLITTMMICSFIYFQCTLAIVSTSACFVVGIVITALNSSDLIEHGSLLTSSIVSLLFNYLNFSTLSANPDATCNVWEPDDYNFLLLFCDLFLCFLSMIFYAFKHNPEASRQSASPMMEMHTINESNSSEVEEETNEISETTQEDSAYFHFLMACYSLTLGMILTNWGLVSGFSTYLSFIVRACQTFALISLFIWSMYAPACCPDRDFSL